MRPIGKNSNIKYSGEQSSQRVPLVVVSQPYGINLMEMLSVSNKSAIQYLNLIRLLAPFPRKWRKIEPQCLPQFFFVLKKKDIDVAIDLIFQ